MSIKCVETAAPGKVILHGEHSVVYNKLAIAASIDVTTHCKFTEGADASSGLLRLDFKNIGLKLSIPHLDLIKEVLSDGKLPLKSGEFSLDAPENLRHDEIIKKLKNFVESQTQVSETNEKNALLAFFYLYVGTLSQSGVRLKELLVEINGFLPIGSGLGSSASFAVSIAGSLFQVLKIKHRAGEVNASGYEVLQDFENIQGFTCEEKALISRWAFEAEKVMHGNPSGLDNTICTFGGIVAYRKGEAPRPLTLNGEGAGFQLECLLIDTKVPKNTKEQVEKVAKLNLKCPEIVQHILSAMDEISKKAVECLEGRGDGSVSKDLNMLFDVNQNMLRSLGVSHSEIDKICNIMAAFGLSAKITGAGGGGYMICLVSKDVGQDKVTKARDTLESAGFSSVCVSLGAEGVRLIS